MTCLSRSGTVRNKTLTYQYKLEHVKRLSKLPEVWDCSKRNVYKLEQVGQAVDEAIGMSPILGQNVFKEEQVHVATIHRSTSTAISSWNRATSADQ